MSRHQRWLIALVALLYVASAASSDPSRLSVDFSSSLIVSPDSTPPAVLQSLSALVSDMTADGVNNVCNGRLSRHVCNRPFTKGISLRTPVLSFYVTLGNTDPSKCTLCHSPAPKNTSACSCAAPGNKTRCTCEGTLTGAQYFDPKWYSLELAYVLAVAENEDNRITGGINANFNSTVRFVNSTLTVAPGDNSGEGTHDLELDESHLDLLVGSQLHLVDDADLEVEDNGGLWLSGSSLINATGNSNIQTQLSHILVEGNSLINIQRGSEWNVTQEFDFTPAQAASVCDEPFTPNAAAEYCFNHKEECKQRFNQLSGSEKQALGMLQYPPALDRWGRQAFDYTDDVVYDDYYDSDYVEPELKAGTCLGPDVCGSSGSSSGKRLRSLLAAPEPAPLPPGVATINNGDSSSNSNSNATATLAGASSSKGNSSNDLDTDSDSSSDQDTDSDSSSSSSSAASPKPQSPNDISDSSDETGGGDDPQGYLSATEVNAPDTLDGKGYDPGWGEGPFGETLCDAPPGKAFNYYGLIVRDSSHIKISANSTWVMYDTSRAFIKDSKITLEQGSTLLLLNSTLTLINSTLEVSGRSQIILQRFSSLQLYGSKVVGDGAMYAVPAGATWSGQQWQQRGDYRASPGGGLPVSMGAKPGVQLGSYPMRVFGFDIEARLLPPAGCNCKEPRTVTTPADKITHVPQNDFKGWNAPLEGLI